MAHEEMGTIREMDIALLEEHHEHLWFYFAENDAWVGKHRDIILETMHDMPAGVKVIHGGTDIPHAFCISKSIENLKLSEAHCLNAYGFRLDHGEDLALQCLAWMRAGDLF